MFIAFERALQRAHRIEARDRYGEQDDEIDHEHRCAHVHGPKNVFG